MTYEDRMHKEEELLEDEFLLACFTKDAEAGVDFSFTKDYKNGGIRRRKVYEVMYDSLDGYDGTLKFVMETLLIIAKKGDVDAESALRRMAKSYAKLNAYVEE